MAHCHVEMPTLVPDDVARKMTVQDREALQDREAYAPRPLDTLKDALIDEQQSESMNHSPFRHVLGERASTLQLGVLGDERPF